VSDIQEKIDLLLTPLELSQSLEEDGFSEDQALSISADIYQPLVEIIKLLNKAHVESIVRVSDWD